MKILVGLSGGLDSTYAAYLLKEQGHEVVGCAVIMHEYTDVSDAKSSAEALNIPFVTLDGRETFKNKVISRFITDYENGRTPNPCIECNVSVKFGVLCDYADKNGFDKVATGHYANIVCENDRYFIRADLTSGKDQSYVLWKLTQKQLSMLYFPLFGLNKDDIREKARMLGFKSADMKESQDICFIPDGDYASFIKKATRKSYDEGDFVDINGNKIGTHKGIINYTVGQRKGLGAYGRPMFVYNVNQADNTVTLVPSGEEYSQSTEIGELNFMKQAPITDTEISCFCRVRYSAKPMPCRVKFEGERAYIIFEEKTRAVTPGQSAVFYDVNDLLFGGIIFS